MTESQLAKLKARVKSRRGLMAQIARDANVSHTMVGYVLSGLSTSAKVLESAQRLLLAGKADGDAK